MPIQGHKEKVAKQACLTGEFRWELDLKSIILSFSFISIAIKYWKILLLILVVRIIKLLDICVTHDN